MYKVFNLLIIFLIFFFYFNIFKYYSSVKNIEEKNFNRNNIDQIINDQISNLQVLPDDTNNVIEFNDSFAEEIKNFKPRSFWNLLKPK